MNQPSTGGLFIRLGHPRDIIQCMRVQLDALRILCASDYSPEQLEALVEQKISGLSIAGFQRQLTWVALQEGLIVGMAARLACHITAVYVHPLCARQGIGSQLLMTLETNARRDGLKSLVVNALLTARPFYLRHGYEVLHASHIVTANHVRIPYLKMQKVLFPLSPAQEQCR